MPTTTWTFDTGYDGWSFEDRSTAPAPFSEANRASLIGSIEVTLSLTPYTGGRSAIGVNIRTGLDAVYPIVVGGDQIEVDFGATDVTTMNVILRAIYTDLTTSTSTVTSSAAGSLTRTLTAGKTLQTIEVQFLNSFSGAAGTLTNIRNVLEVRLITSATLTFQTRVIGLDIDVEDGTRRWLTAWENDYLYLLRYNASLGNEDIIQFGGATEAELDAKTYIIFPYSPPFFGVADFGDYIYVHGRWDDGGAVHLSVSTDVGASFSDIGDSATWGAGWVGGFFAQDANTLYAFVNGGSRALYRTTNGGSTWTSLSSLPFDVEPGGVSVHPDGRILIINRDASPAMAAYAVAPDYSSWIDATGSPAFPQAGGGSNAVIWIT